VQIANAVGKCEDKPPYDVQYRDYFWKVRHHWEILMQWNVYGIKPIDHWPYTSYTIGRLVWRKL